MQELFCRGLELHPDTQGALQCSAALSVYPACRACVSLGDHFRAAFWEGGWEREHLCFAAIGYRRTRARHLGDGMGYYNYSRVEYEYSKTGG